MAAPMDRRVWPRFIVQFVNEHIDFRIPELENVAKTVNASIRYVSQYDHLNPFVVVDLPSKSCAERISGRSILIRSIFEYWASGRSHSDIHTQVKHLSSDFLKPFKRPDATLRFVVDGYNRKIPQEEKMEKITALMALVEPQGRVHLSSPDYSLHLLEHYELDTHDLQNVYLGAWLADGQRDLPKRYNLQTRNFIGNTSMDPGLSLIMANMAGVRPADVVMDPFVGTGSLLVSAAHFGAYVMGTDIDYMLLHGRARPSRVGQTVRAAGESVHSNLRQYEMASQCLDVMVADTSRHAMWRDDVRFDAIVTDPPYGIREACIKVGANENPKPIGEDVRESRIPNKEKYTLSSVFLDLMLFAAKFLRLHGRLVYWLPVNREKYTADCLPGHPCLALVANSEQPITKRIGRRLVTMEKVEEYQGEAAIGSEAMRVHLDAFRDDCFLPADASCAADETSARRRGRRSKTGAHEVDLTIKNTTGHVTHEHVIDVNRDSENRQVRVTAER